MVVEIISGGFALAHAIACLLAVQMVRRGNKLLLMMASLHAAAIPLIFYYFELVSLLSFPLIMVTVIAFILEDKPGKPQ
ncbi:MAG: hypothetical protein ABIG96_04540 [Candidatus Micrarchaeota archaeon]